MRLLIILLIFLSSCSRDDFVKVKLLKVIDGDSLQVQKFSCDENLAKQDLDCKPLEIRMLGIDAPEYKQTPWGPEAREFLLDEASHSKYLKIEFDIEKFDKYNRVLAYVYNDQDQMLNEKILENGFAQIFIIGLNKKHANTLKLAQSKAKSQVLNIWHPQNGLKMSPYEFRKKKS